MDNDSINRKVIQITIIYLSIFSISQKCFAQNNSIEIKSISTTHSSVKIQIPIVKLFSIQDSSLVKKNIKETNNKIYKKLKAFDSKGYEYVNIKPTVISNDSGYLSISIEEELTGGTTQYYDWNILIDKSTGLMISPNQAFQHFGFSLADVQNQINDWIKPCMDSDRQKVPEKCMDAELESFVERIADDSDISSEQPSGVYLKNGNLGVSFDTNKFSPSFEFDLKTKKITNK